MKNKKCYVQIREFRTNLGTHGKHRLFGIVDHCHQLCYYLRGNDHFQPNKEGVTDASFYELSTYICVEEHLQDRLRPV